MTGKIKSITRGTAALIQDRVKMALADIEQETGLKIEVDLNTIASEGMTLKVKASLDLPLEETDAGRAFIALAGRYGLSASDLGRDFMLGGDVFRLTGIKTSRPKYPLQGVRVKDGKDYKFTVGQFTSAYKPGKAAA